MPALQVTRYTDVPTFTAAVEPFLLEHEAAHCLQLGLLGQFADGYWPERRLFTVAAGGRPLLVALQTPPHPLILSVTDRLDAVSALVRDLARTAPCELPAGVMGPADVLRQFEADWNARPGWTARLTERERIYQLERVLPVSGVAGQPRRAQTSDLELLTGWYREFHLEALGDDPGDVRETVGRRLNPSGPGGLWLWTDQGVPVSFLGAGSPTRSGIRIGPVYTPPEQRRCGYAAALTAHVSQQLLDSGRRFCFLFTDLNNPTSNHIYRQVGYRPVSDVNKLELQAG